MGNRASGILLHISSLPSRFGIGDLGPEAQAFAGALREAGQTLWQILPLNPTRDVFAHSPYSSASAFAGNPLFISPALMLRDGYIDENSMPPLPAPAAEDRVDFRAVEKFKTDLIDRAFEKFTSAGASDVYNQFKQREQSWLDPHAEFTAISRDLDEAPLRLWPEGLRERREKEMATARERLEKKIEKEKFVQFLFHVQWFEFKTICGHNKVELVGDLPIYVNADSADVWSRPELFRLAPDKSPAVVAGVPPDYFSITGQRWGNPIYNWERMEKRNFEWWSKRLAHASHLFDRIRIDHFRGFAAYWEIAAEEKLAIKGKWIKAPGREFFDALTKKLPHLKIIAEDLGMITPDVTKLRTDFGFPGMKVLMFAFSPTDDGKENAYLPHMAEPDSVVYTGTHDNNTARGWFENEATEEEKKNLSGYAKTSVTAENISRTLLELAFSSPADSAIVPMQDILGLGANARMNTPSTTIGNWTWRLMPGQFGKSEREYLLDAVRKHKRTA